jgi:MarR family transcriptional regulator, transcriptional regulator for hemolysin
MMIWIQIIGTQIIGIRMTQSDFRAIAIEMRILQHALGKISREEIDRRLAALDAGVSVMQFFLMHTLRREEQTLSELSRKMLLDPSTLVPLVDALERKGFVRRNRDPRDRRRIPLTLTDDALRLIGSIPTVDESDVVMQALTRMGHEKATQLVELLREMVKNLPNGEALIAEIGSRVDTYKDDQHCPPPKSGHQII